MSNLDNIKATFEKEIKDMVGVTVEMTFISTLEFSMLTHDKKSFNLAKKFIKQIPGVKSNGIVIQDGMFVAYFRY